MCLCLHARMCMFTSMYLHILICSKEGKIGLEYQISEMRIKKLNSTDVSL
uniref:Uncharacterized protein n=1 Tax=Rhizophora mucronata TaxID=61149 RepID=A0A2P2J6V1_RHIMU